jgi:hypothetical protein
MQSLLQLKNYDCVIWALYLDTQGEVADDRINKIKIKFLYQQICVFLLMSNDSEKIPIIGLILRLFKNIQESFFRTDNVTGTDGHNGAVSRTYSTSIASVLLVNTWLTCDVLSRITLANNTVETFQLTGLRVG